MTDQSSTAQYPTGPTPDEIAHMIRNFTYQARMYDAQGITPRDVFGGDDDA